MILRHVPGSPVPPETPELILGTQTESPDDLNVAGKPHTHIAVTSGAIQFLYVQTWPAAQILFLTNYG